MKVDRDLMQLRRKSTKYNWDRFCEVNQMMGRKTASMVPSVCALVVFIVAAGLALLMF